MTVNINMFNMPYSLKRVERGIKNHFRNRDEARTPV